MVLINPTFATLIPRSTNRLSRRTCCIALLLCAAMSLLFRLYARKMHHIHQTARASVKMGLTPPVFCIFQPPRDENDSWLRSAGPHISSIRQTVRHYPKWQTVTSL